MQGFWNFFWSVICPKRRVLGRNGVHRDRKNTFSFFSKCDVVKKSFFDRPSFFLYNARMFIRPCTKKSKGKKLAYWALVESCRTPQCPRQRIVAYLGQLKESERKGIKNAAEQNGNTSFVQALRDSSDGASGDSASVSGTENPSTVQKIIFETDVVKIWGLQPKKTRGIRGWLSNLG